MIAVIFEVEVKPEGKMEYLQIAAKLRQNLDQFKGFISNERFSSMNQEGKVLSLSFWENEEAVNNWKHHLDHIAAQKEAKDRLFLRYKLRIANVFREIEGP